jgi:hypothetical protein
LRGDRQRQTIDGSTDRAREYEKAWDSLDQRDKEWQSAFAVVLIVALGVLDTVHQDRRWRIPPLLSAFSADRLPGKGHVTGALRR